MSSWIQANRRLMRSALALKAFYEGRLKVRMELLTEPPLPQLDTDLSFPESLTEYGVWGLRLSEPLPLEVREDIRTTCRAVLGSIEQMERRREQLELMQNHLERAAEDVPSNIVAFKRRAPLKPAPAFDSIRDKRWILRLDCLIESKISDDIHKMAAELHESSQRLAFVELFSLESSVRQSLSKLIALGPITIFVPNILQLTSLEMEIFRHLISQEDEHRPLLMVGSEVPYADLRANPLVDLEFLTLLARAYIKMTRPFSEYKDQGLIHYFLDSLSENPT